MGNRFTQQSVNQFLLEQGCDEVHANFISNFVVTALRSVSVHAEIAKQEANEDFTAYHVEVAARNGDGFIVDYSVNKLGPGFLDHRAKITTPESEYTVTRLIYEEAPVAAAPRREEVTQTVAEAPVTDWSDVVVGDINAEIVAELEKAAETFVEAVVTEDAPAEVTVIDTPEALVIGTSEDSVEDVAEAPKAKKGKAKKKAD